MTLAAMQSQPLILLEIVFRDRNIFQFLMCYMIFFSLLFFCRLNVAQIFRLGGYPEKKMFMELSVGVFVMAQKLAIFGWKWPSLPTYTVFLAKKWHWAASAPSELVFNHHWYAIPLYAQNGVLVNILRNSTFGLG